MRAVETAKPSRVKPLSRAKLGEGMILAAIALVSISLQTPFNSPPRFDGSGYAALAESLRTGRGYHAIDQAGAPPHAHFPPGYPLALGGLWTLTGPSLQVAHGFSVACTVGAVLNAWAWFRRRADTSLAFGFGCALALNWTWGRTGGSIQSEPLYLLLSMIVLNVFNWVAGGRPWRGYVIGGLLAGCALTRHVGVMLALAVIVELGCHRRWMHGASALVAFVGGLTPWLLWQAQVRDNTQVALLPRKGILNLIWNQTVFYAARIPDSITGPLVEVATVFHVGDSALRIVAMVWAVMATAIVFLGWLACLRRPSLRLAAWVPCSTLGLLVVWPYTEAGRFLVPLVPFVLIGAIEGIALLASFTKRVDHTQARWIGMFIVLGLSLPYELYSIVARRACAAEQIHADFDAACAWIVQDGRRPGAVLVRQGAEAFWLMGRSRLTVTPSWTTDLSSADSKHEASNSIAYMIDEGDRYSGAPSSSISAIATRRPDRVKLVWKRGKVAIYEVQDP